MKACGRLAADYSVLLTCIEPPEAQQFSDAWFIGPQLRANKSFTRNFSQGGTCLARGPSIGIPKMGLTYPVSFAGPLDSAVTIW